MFGQRPEVLDHPAKGPFYGARPSAEMSGVHRIEAAPKARGAMLPPDARVPSKSTATTLKNATAFPSTAGIRRSQHLSDSGDSVLFSCQLLTRFGSPTQQTLLARARCSVGR